jgi:hypothetical protein
MPGAAKPIACDATAGALWPWCLGVGPCKRRAKRQRYHRMCGVPADSYRSPVRRIAENRIWLFMDSGAFRARLGRFAAPESVKSLWPPGRVRGAARHPPAVPGLRPRPRHARPCRWRWSEVKAAVRIVPVPRAGAEPRTAVSATWSSASARLPVLAATALRHGSQLAWKNSATSALSTDASPSGSGQPDLPLRLVGD